MNETEMNLVKEMKDVLRFVKPYLEGREAILKNKLNSSKNKKEVNQIKKDLTYILNLIIAFKKIELELEETFIKLG